MLGNQVVRCTRKCESHRDIGGLGGDTLLNLRSLAKDSDIAGHLINQSASGFEVTRGLGDEVF